MTTSNQINLNVIVSGQPVDLTIPPKSKVGVLADLALVESNNLGQHKESWEMRTADGALLEYGVRLADAGVIEGMDLYLSPKAGVGG